MLEFDDYVGVKTGITPAAGPCLSACFQKQNEVPLIVVLLNSRSMEARWNEVPKLVQWALTKLEKIKTSNLHPKA